MKKLIVLLSLAFAISLTTPAQESQAISKVTKQDNKLSFSVKDKDSISVYINGKKFDAAILELLDADKIASVNIIKGKDALKNYDSPNVILIETKKEKDKINIVVKENNKLVINDDEEKLEKVVVIVDGEEKDEAYLQEISPDDIFKIEIFKDAKHKKKFKTENGVIMVTTKKKVKKEKEGKEEKK